MANEIIIEIDAPHNANVVFHPIQSVLRGRWLDTRIPSGHGSRNTQIRDIKDVPGMRIALDVQAKKARVFDPLGEQQYRQLCLDIRTKWQTSAGVQPLIAAPVEPIPEKEFNLTQEQVATWWHWMKRLCAQGDARHVSGTWGTQPKGRIKVNFYDWNRRNPQYLDEFVDGLHPEPVEPNATP